MVAILADDNLGDQSGTGDAAGNRPLRRGRARHAVLAMAASVLRADMLMNFQLGWNMFEYLRYVFANAILSTPTATADLLFGRQVQFVSMVWQNIK